MNYDPYRWCQGCQKPQKRAEFVRIRGKRWERCAKCAEETAKRDEEIKRGKQ